jgi:hypothetical protein
MVFAAKSAMNALPRHCIRNRKLHMKINLIPTSKLAILCAAVCATMFAFSHNARALTPGDGHTLGASEGTVDVDDATRLLFVNHLIAMAAPSGETFMGNFFDRSSNTFGGITLPNATAGPGTVTVPFTSNPVSIDIGSGVYSYLYATYNSAINTAVVWYIGDLNGTITIPGFFPGYSLSGYTLFGPGTGTGVPDGGTTAMSLCAAFGAFGVARRFLEA